MLLDSAICSWDTSAFLLIFSDNVYGNFIYYSHIFPALCIITFLVLLLKHSKKNVLIGILAIMGLSFTAWSYADLVLWADANPDHIMFFWSILAPLELLIYLSALYFVLYYINNKFPGWKFDLGILLLSLPILLFSHTTLNLTAFDYTNCYREAVEGPLIAYLYVLEIGIALTLVVYTMRAFAQPVNTTRRKEIGLVTLGTTLLLFSYSLGNILGSLEVDYELGQYGLFAFPLFVGLLAYMTAKYRAFNAKIIGAEVLVIAIILLVSSLLLTHKIENLRIIASITAVVTAILGYMLIRGVKREIAQKEEIERLASDLKRANERLKELDRMKSEFVSIASHQLRSPLTSIRGYASMLAEGSYGKIPQKAADIIERIGESARFMATSVEDYLSVSRIEAGNMKYEMSDFNLKEVTERIVDDMRPSAIKKGLVLMFRSDCNGSCSIRADIGKTRQIIMNLLDNSMKYTQKGSITVVAHDDVKKKKMYLTITDTGVGINPNIIGDLFEKFVRAKNANCVNVTGTGLGLYVVRKMIVAMGGSVTASSEGEGMGTTFKLEFPLLPGNPTQH